MTICSYYILFIVSKNSTVKKCVYIIFLSTQNGRTPLIIASYEGHTDIVRTLINAKAKVNTQSEVWYLSQQNTHCDGGYMSPNISEIMYIYSRLGD